MLFGLVTLTLQYKKKPNRLKGCRQNLNSLNNISERVWTVRLKQHIKPGLEPGFTVQIVSQNKDWSLLERYLIDNGHGHIGGCACDSFWDWD